MKIMAKCSLEKQKLQLLPNAVIPNLTNIPKVPVQVQKPSPCIIHKITKRPTPQENKKSKVVRNVMTACQITNYYPLVKKRNRFVLKSCVLLLHKYFQYCMIIDLIDILFHRL